uniref:hypothetical protein n=1 Tax=Agathobacter sp. TaxID=2021311 RepID=UPI004056735E
MKKAFVALLAAVMVLGSTVTALAAPSASASDVATGTVAELKAGFEGATSDAGEVTIKEVSSDVAASAQNAVVDILQDRTDDVKAKILALADISLPGGKGTIKFAVDGVFSTDTTSTIIVLHWNGTAWEKITPDKVEAGYVTATFTSLSPVAVVKVIPEAGKFGVGFSTVALMAAAGLAGAVVCGKKKSN